MAYKRIELDKASIDNKISPNRGVSLNVYSKGTPFENTWVTGNIPVANAIKDIIVQNFNLNSSFTNKTDNAAKSNITIEIIK